MHPQVAALHWGDRDVEATGWMRIHRASTWRCRAVSALLRLPRPGDRVRTELLITRDGRNERWVRRFGGGPAIRSQQSAGPHGELVEQFGPVAFVFAVELAGDQIRFHQRRCRLRLWWLDVPLPGALAPRVDAVAGPAPGGGVAVSVRAGLGRLGLLLAYEGTVDIRRTCDANRFVAAGPARAHRRI